MAALLHHRKLMLFSDEASNTPPIEHPPDSTDPFSSSFVLAFLPAIMTTALLCGCFCIYRWSSWQSQPPPPPQELYGGGVDHRRWYVRTTGGLPPSVINAIAIYRYKTGEGAVEGSDCAVCLSEFQEDEILRMLPNCKHAFHVPCIDTWLKSHTNCPVCRADFESTENSDVALPALVLTREPGRIPVNNGGEREEYSEAHECRSAVNDKEDESTEQNVVPKNNVIEHS